jgi:hypothetical protein
MADLRNPAEVEALVGAVVDQATAGLSAAATDADERRADLAAARKRTGNRRRTDEIKAAIEAEDVLAADARALAKRTAALQQDMADDLQKLVALTLAPGEG